MDDQTDYKIFSVALAPEVRASLDLLAKLAGMSRGAVVRCLIQDAIHDVKVLDRLGVDRPEDVVKHE